MRSALSALLLAACACGNLSNQDIAFLEALPQKDQLHVVVPGNGSAQTACAIGTADVWNSAKTSGDGINASASRSLYPPSSPSKSDGLTRLFL